MIYDSNRPFDWQRLLLRFSTLYERGKQHRVVIELTDKTNRTLSQNSYLHVIIGYLALQIGDTMENVKVHCFKISANRDTFLLGWSTNRYTGIREPRLRSTRDLSTEEMSVCIDRFIDWSATTAGVLLPRADEKEFVQQCAIDVENAKQYL